MKGYTHLLGGLAAAGVAISLHAPHPLTLLAAAGAGGLLPDWDLPQSWVGRWIPWPAVSASRGGRLPPRVGRAGWPHPIWHRQQGHSVAGVALASGIAAWLAASASHAAGVRNLSPFWVAAGLFLGGISHLALDGFNDERQWWLWPLTRRGFRWPLHAGVRYTDQATSAVLSAVLIVLAWHLGHPWLQDLASLAPADKVLP